MYLSTAVSGNMARPLYIDALEVMRMKKLTFIFLALTVLVSGCVSVEEQTRQLLDDISGRQPWLMAGSSNIITYRNGIEALEEVQRLLGLGSIAADIAMQRIQNSNINEPDGTMAICAYLIERNVYTAAVPVLEAYLLSGLNQRGYVWSPHFAARALFVLKGIADPSDGKRAYDGQEFALVLNSP